MNSELVGVPNSLEILQAEETGPNSLVCDVLVADCSITAERKAGEGIEKTLSVAERGQFVLSAKALREDGGLGVSGRKVHSDD